MGRTFQTRTTQAWVVSRSNRIFQGCKTLLVVLEGSEEGPGGLRLLLEIVARHLVLDPDVRFPPCPGLVVCQDLEVPQPGLPARKHWVRPLESDLSVSTVLLATSAKCNRHLLLGLETALCLEEAQRLATVRSGGPAS